MSHIFNRAVQSQFNSGELTTVNNIRVEFSCVNNNSNGSAKSLIFNDLRTDRILDDAGSYYVAVERFHISTINLPVIIAQIETGQSDPNLTEYSFTMVYNGNSFQSYLQFIPQNVNEPVPNAPLDFQDMSSKYYFVSSYKYMVGLINNTLKSAFNGLNALSTLPTNETPFILYDPLSSSMLFNADSSYFDVSNTNTNNIIYIYANNLMYNLLSGFEWKNMGNNSLNLNHQLQIYSDFGTNILQLEINSVQKNIIQCYEEYPSVKSWSCVQSICLIANNLPIQQTIVNDTKKYNSRQGMSNTSSNSTLNVLSDFTVPYPENYIPSVDYTSPARLKLVDMYGIGQTIKNIEISIMWKDIYGNLYPMQLASGCDSNLVLIFVKKSFYH